MGNAGGCIKKPGKSCWSSRASSAWPLAAFALFRHENGQGAPAEAMLPDMLSRNTSEVDTISGATLSSKAIRAAMRDALAKGAAN